MQDGRLGLVAEGLQAGQRVVGLRLRGGAGDQARRGQCSTAVAAAEGQRGAEGKWAAHGACGQRCAGLQQVGVAEVVVQRPAARRVDRPGAALDAEIAAGGDLDVGLAHCHAVDQPGSVLLGRGQGRTCAVAHAAGNHQRVGWLDELGAPAVGQPVAKAIVQHPEGELDGLQRVRAPILLGVLLGMRVLDGEPVGRGGVESGALGSAQPCAEVGGRAQRGRVAAPAVDGDRGVGLQVVHAGAGALVGVGHGTAALQPPFAGRADSAVHAA